MQSVSQPYWLAYPPAAVYQTLTDPDKLASIVKRLENIEVIDRDGDSGEVLATIDLPGGKTLQTRGQVEGVPHSDLSFKTEEPVKLNIIWKLSSATKDQIDGCDVVYTIEVDLTPVAAFISGLVLKGFLSTEMLQDLERLEILLAASFNQPEA